jgi:transcriptional regulator with XRE-family HTH domain
MNSDLERDIRDFITEKRKAKALTQAQLAKNVFGDANRRDVISKIEHGKRNVSIGTLDKILKYFNAEIVIIEH